MHGQARRCRRRCPGSGRRSRAPCSSRPRRGRRPRRSAAPCRPATGSARSACPARPRSVGELLRVRRRLGPVGRRSARSAGRRRSRPASRSGDWKVCWICSTLVDSALPGSHDARRRSSARRSACRPTGRRGRPPRSQKTSTRNFVRRPVSRRAADPVMISPSCASRRAGDAIDRPPRASTTFAPALRKPQKRCPARQSRVQCSAGERSPADTASGPTALRPPAQAGA